MYQLVLIMHIIAAACIIVLVLVQQGKGATIGSSFGAGASQTIFGSRGAGSFLLKLTLGFVFAFFGTSIALNWMSSHAVKQSHMQSNQLPAGLLESGPAMPVIPTESPTNEPLSPATGIAPLQSTDANETPESATTAIIPVAPSALKSPLKHATESVTTHHATKKSAKVKATKNLKKKHSTKSHVSGNQ